MSKDPSTKVGACVANGKKLISIGYNGFSSKVEDKNEWLEDRETKYKLVIHAEINALLNCRERSMLENATLYVYPLFPCSSCAAVLSNSGIKRIVVGLNDKASNSPLKEKFMEDAKFIFNSAGIMLDVYKFNE